MRPADRDAIPKPPKPSARVLLAGPCIAEFGWEIMSWQAWVRRVAAGYDHIVVCTTRGLEALYADFCRDFVSHNVDGLRNCWFLERETNTSHAAERRLATIGNEFRAAGWHVERIKPSGFVAPAEQHFVRYGAGAACVPPDLRFDVILHARNKASNNGTLACLNWPQREWDGLAMRLTDHGLRVACIGARSTALLARTAVDLRDLPLRRTMDALSAARLVVGPSSGPMHLASLCGVRHIVWTVRIEERAWKVWGSSRERYERIWNPFATPCTVVEVTSSDAPGAGDKAQIVLEALKQG